MSSELGNISLCLALSMAVMQLLLMSRALLHSGQTQQVNQGHYCAWGQLFFIGVAFASLVAGFISNDLSILYVRQHSDYSLPLFYRIGAVWGGHEGSLLLWVFILSLWQGLFACFAKRLEPSLLLRFYWVMALLQLGFYLFILQTSNPFLTDLSELPLAGQDLNPMLQDPGLIIHPPMLYLGYVGYGLIYGLAVAALWQGKLDREWALAIRPWALMTWVFLTLGIVLGSWWAYHVLGWGGWWFWDPVENASFMPWLAGTALIHSIQVTVKRQGFKSWTILLCLICFALSLMGTFLVRCGVLISVHAFANDPGRGTFLLFFLGIVGLASLILYGCRAGKLTTEDNFNLISRESFLLFNNVILLVLLGTVLLGTVYPILLDALGLGQLSVGVPYFNKVFVPLVVPLLLGMGFAANCHWQEMPGNKLLQIVKWPLVLAISFGVFICFLTKQTWSWQVVLGLGLSCWILLATLRSLMMGKRRWRSQLAMGVAHMGIALVVLGITVETQYHASRELRMRPGETVMLGKHLVTMVNTEKLQGVNYAGTKINFTVHNGEQGSGTVTSEKRIYRINNFPMTKVGLLVGLWSDIYVAIGEPLPNQAWSVRMYYKPFIRCIWLGGLLTLLGGVLALPWRRVHD